MVLTEPYQALTTTDLNIGVVKALQRANGSIYGVIGVDITLSNLTSYISSIQPIGGGKSC